MSVQQSRVRTSKFAEIWNKFQPDGNAMLNDLAMQRMYELRCMMWSFDTLAFSMAERKYIDIRWPAVYSLVMSESAEELVMKSEVQKLGIAYSSVDYLVTVIGLLMQFTEKSMDVCIALVDECTELDDFFKSAKCMKALLKVAFARRGVQMRCKKNAFKLIAHVLKKFPDMKKQRYMLSKRNNALRCKFTDEMIERYL